MSKYNKENPLRVFEAFAGYGSQHMAFERIKKRIPVFDFKVVGISEIDKWALQAYEAVHGECPNYGDISKINWEEVPDFDFFSYSFPCTDISNAGLQKGLSEGSGTRSGLLWECRKAIEAKKPKYLMMENVKALMSKKFMPEFNKWRDYLESLHYESFTKILNATECGIPQNRERVFMVSILRESDDDMPIFRFPEPIPLEKKLKDVLEPAVDDKYELSEKSIKGFLQHNENHEEKGTGFI